MEVGLCYSGFLQETKPIECILLCHQEYTCVYMHYMHYMYYMYMNIYIVLYAYIYYICVCKPYVYIISFVCVWVKREIKELAHINVEAGKFQICRTGGQVADSRKSWHCIFNLKTVCWQNPSPSLGGPHLFSPAKSLTGRGRPHYGG